MIDIDIMELLEMISAGRFDHPIKGCTELLRRAEAMGLIKRNSSTRGQDGAERVYPVVLTDKGRAHNGNPLMRLYKS